MARINNKLRSDYDARLTAGYRYDVKHILTYLLVILDDRIVCVVERQGGGARPSVNYKIVCAYKCSGVERGHM